MRSNRAGGGRRFTAPIITSSLAARIGLAPLAAFVLAILIPGGLALYTLRAHADREVQTRAASLMAAFVGAGTSGRVRHAPAECALPAARAGVGEVDLGEGSRARIAALGMRAAAMRPAGQETRIIAALDGDRRLTEFTDEVNRPGGACFALARPIVADSDGCIRCHASLATPGAADYRVAAGSWQKGQVVGAYIVYVPFTAPRAEAASLVWRVGACAAALALLGMLALVWRCWTLVTLPVRRLEAATAAMRGGDWSVRYAPDGPDEISTLARGFQEVTFWLREQIAREERLRSLFQQFIPASVAARALGRDSDEVLAGTRHAVTVMIINIRNFKLLMEHLPPEQTVSTLNEYFAEVNKAIVAHGGLVSRYMGDSVMAFFGMPVAREEHALQAIRAALDIPRALQDLYVRLDETYGWQLGVGIGVSTGEPIVGHFGSSVHMEYTVLGEVVQEAHWLEEVSKGVPEEDTILITEATYRRVMSEVHVYEVGDRAAADGHLVHAYAVQGLRSEARSALAS